MPGLSNFWVTLPSSWKLQDVQAGLNVIIAFLCAASIFVLVRHFWVLAARQVAKKRDVPAYALLSLNTVGESIDVLWLLRHEILTARYRSLLIQCVFVVLLTVCTLSSGWIARFSSRSVITIEVRPVVSSLASRFETYLLNDILDISTVFDGLKAAKFPQTKLAEFWPDPNSNWTFNDAQWNSSWTMECTYNQSIAIPNPEIVTNNCTNGLWQQWPPIKTAWTKWPQKAGNTDYGYNDDWISYQTESGSIIKDMYVFTQGVEILEMIEVGSPAYNITTSMTMQTVAFHLSDIPANTNAKSDCNFAKGPIGSASYTSATCHLTRNVGNKTGEDLDHWGTSPDYFNIPRQLSMYPQFYSGRLRRESRADVPITTIPGSDLVTLWQAYQITKDTSGSVDWNITEKVKPQVIRDIDVQVRAAQISLTCLIVCCVMATIALLGITNYWIFLLRNLKTLNQTPQSKLDWMLQTLRSDATTVGHGTAYAYAPGHVHTPSADHPDPNVNIRHKLRNSVLIGSQHDLHSDMVPLTKVGDANDERDLSHKKSYTTSIVSTHSINPIYEDSPAVVPSDYSGGTMTTPHTGGMTAPWSMPGQQYQQVSGGPGADWQTQQPQYHVQPQQTFSPGLGIMGRSNGSNGQYERLGSLPSPYEPHGQMDTTYDPGRRWN